MLPTAAVPSASLLAIPPSPGRTSRLRDSRMPGEALRFATAAASRWDGLLPEARRGGTAGTVYARVSGDGRFHPRRLSRALARVAREPMREQDGQRRDGDDEDGDDVRHRPLAGFRQLAEHPDGERLLLAGGERRDDDLIEGEGEGQPRPCQ